MTQYRYRVEVPPYADDSYTEHALRAARHETVRKLLEELHNGRYYTIRIDEHWPKDIGYRKWQAERDRYFGPNNDLIYEIEVEINQVETRRIVMPEPVYFEDMPPLPLTLSAVDEMKRRLKYKLGRPFRWLDARAKQVDREKRAFRG